MTKTPLMTIRTHHVYSRGASYLTIESVLLATAGEPSGRNTWANVEPRYQPLAPSDRKPAPTTVASKTDSQLRKSDMSKTSNKNRVMVSIPRQLKERLDRLAGEINESYELGRGYQDLVIADQGSRGTWIPLHAVISRALDELEGHRERSRKSSNRNTKTESK